MAKVNLLKCLLVSLIAYFMLPFYYALFHKATSLEQERFSKAYAVVLRKYTECTESGKKEVIEYALRRYNKLGPYDVTNMKIPSCAGFNCPWCPGIVVTPEFTNNPEIYADLIIHEAAHDFFPWLGHSTHKRLEIW